MHVIERLSQRRARRKTHGAGRMRSEKVLILYSPFRRYQLRTAQGLLKEFAQIFVLCVAAGDPVAFHDAASVGVDHENRMLAGVEQNRVRGFRTNPVQREQLLSQLFGRLREQAPQRASVVLVDECYKSL